MSVISKEKALKYFKLSKHLADLFSKDPDKKVGCLILSKETYRILATGINGFPRHLSDTKERWERTNKSLYVIHAEQNAIANSANSGTSIDNSIAIINMFPCKECAKILIQSGVKTIVTVQPNINHIRWGESSKISLEMFTEVGIEILFVEDEI